jgi:hypothetical protein
MTPKNPSKSREARAMKLNYKRNVQLFAESVFKGRTINPVKKAEALENIKKDKNNKVNFIMDEAYLLMEKQEEYIRKKNEKKKEGNKNNG